MGAAINGVLLDAAEASGFELFVTADKNIGYQQDLAGEKSPSWSLAMRSGRFCADTWKGSC